jgi:hypothetical protein
VVVLLHPLLLVVVLVLLYPSVLIRGARCCDSCWCRSSCISGGTPKASISCNRASEALPSVFGIISFSFSGGGRLVILIPFQGAPLTLALAKISSGQRTRRVACLVPWCSSAVIAVAVDPYILIGVVESHMQASV